MLPRAPSLFPLRLPSLSCCPSRLLPSFSCHSPLVFPPRFFVSANRRPPLILATHFCPSHRFSGRIPPYSPHLALWLLLVLHMFLHYLCPPTDYASPILTRAEVLWAISSVPSNMAQSVHGLSNSATPLCSTSSCQQLVGPSLPQDTSSSSEGVLIVGGHTLAEEPSSVDLDAAVTLIQLSRGPSKAEVDVLEEQEVISMLFDDDPVG
ncbi:hypothetical protein C8Q76DRAFT_690210 [Earliella scabrosa]|nr:hypothetical protein C8Q76DRAFT_690210 [Earliella scabrosa]